MEIDDCIQNGDRWMYGFDISGHIFLMSFSNLIIMNELRYLFKLKQFHEFNYLNKFNQNRRNNFVDPYRFKNETTYWLSLILTIIMFTIMVIWDFMMIQTSLFYHNLLQKISGFIWALVSWFIIYVILDRFIPVISDKS